LPFQPEPGQTDTNISAMKEKLYLVPLRRTTKKTFADPDLAQSQNCFLFPAPERYGRIRVEH